MISLKDYANADATQLAAWVRARELSAAELEDAARRAIEAVNPQINAVLQNLSGQRANPDGPFAGVPFLLKELVCHAAGVRCDMGSRLAQGYVPATDTELMARFRHAGLGLLGTTQTPELGYNPTTETVLFGPVRNPWNPEHSAGGSSGGSGAAVAAGVVPVAHANDGGGSIRIPAACNGVVGLKPSRDRVPLGPDLGDALFGLACEFVVTRSVRDAAALLDCVAGPDVGPPSLIPDPSRPFADEVGAPPDRLRIAFTSLSPAGVPVDPECARGVQRTAALLESLGHEVVEASPFALLHWEEFLDHTHVIWTSFNAFMADGAAETMEREASPETLEAVTWACVQDGRGRSAAEVIRALDYNNKISRQVGAFFEDFDVALSPTIAREPAPLGEIDQNAPITAREWTEQVFGYVPFTPLFNTTGQPAISLPLHQAPSGLPVGMQLAGRLGDESTLLRLASQLEEALPWRDRKPPIHASLL